MVQEKSYKNAYILTVNITVLPSLSDTVSLSSSPLYSQSNTQPLSKSTTLSLQSSSMKSLHPMLRKTNISLTSHCIFANLNVETMP